MPSSLSKLFAVLMAMLALLLCSNKAAATAAPTRAAMEVDAEQPVQEVSAYASYLRDPRGQLSLDELVSLQKRGELLPSEDKLDFGFTSDTIWVHFVVENTKSYDQQFVLTNRYPLIDQLEFYELEHGELVRSTRLGDTLPFYARPLQTTVFANPIRVHANSKKEIFVRVKSRGSVSAPMELSTLEYFAERQHTHMLILGFMFGIMAGLSVYNLLLFFQTKEREYLTFVGMCLCMLLFNLAMDGVSFLLLPDAVQWQQIAVYESLCLVGIFTSRFTRAYFQTEEYCPKLGRAIHALEWWFAVNAALFVVIQTKIQGFGILMMIFPSVLIIISTALVRYRQAYGPAKHFLVAWSALALLVVAGYLSATGVFDVSGVAPYLYKIGHTAEMTLLSMALAARMSNAKADKERAEKAAELAIASSQAKSDFLAKMSHEIRTPMNGVLGMAELLKKTSLKPSQMQFLTTIERSGQSLLSVINDILDYSKLESGKMSVENRRFDLHAVLDDVHTTFSLRAKEKKLDVLLCVEPQVRRWVVGDEVRIQQILINLMGNALKFTTEGQVRLEVGMVEASDTLVSFSVQDTGIGIAQSAISTLFDSFSQEDTSVTRQYGGTGLGLSICKQLVELMSGTIGVESKKGSGSNFHFELPLEAGEAPPEQSRFEAEVSQAIMGKRVAMVAHAGTMASHLAQTLHGWGIELQIHEPSAIAQKWPDCRNIDLVLFHESLTNQERSALLKRFWEVHRDDAMRLLIRKKVDDEEISEGMLQTQRVHCLLQPSGRLPFRDALGRCLGAAKAAQGKRLAESQGQVFRSYAHLRVLVAEDTPVNQLVLKKMLRHFDIDAEIVANGELAVAAVLDSGFCYDIIFMDCEMPVMDGLQATREIRRLEAQGHPRCAIYALTAHALVEHRQKAFAAGMDAYFTKPVSLASLRDALEQFEKSKMAA